jgi:hypothetical protein
MTKGEKVVKKAFEYLGVKEQPMGSNRGPDIDRWEARWGLKGEPWCGMFSDAMYSEAGVDDSGINHPATSQICVNGKKHKWDGRSTIPPGSLWVNCGVHVAIVTKHNEDGTVSTIEGNKSNMVATGRRPIAGATIIIPPAIKDDVPEPVKWEYWLEDTQARPQLLTVNGKVARWKSKAARDKTLELLKNNPDYRPLRPRPVSRGEGKNKRYFILIGNLRYYGPFGTVEIRNAAQKSLEKRLGHGLRRFRKKAS